jgi:hypothetical protein
MLDFTVLYGRWHLLYHNNSLLHAVGGVGAGEHLSKFLAQYNLANLKNAGLERSVPRTYLMIPLGRYGSNINGYATKAHSWVGCSHGWLMQ